MEQKDVFIHKRMRYSGSLNKSKSVQLVLVGLCFVWTIACERSVSHSRTVTNSNEPNVNESRIKNGKLERTDAIRDDKATPSFNEQVLIQSGFGTGKIHLGMSREGLLERLGPPNEEYSHNSFCTYVEMHWLPKAHPDGSMPEGNGIFAYLRDNRVYELSFSANEYQTTFGVSDSTSAKVAIEKLGWPLFLLTPSANTATYHEDLMYLVNSDDGIAFELGVGYKTKKRFVYAIYVFAPGSEFLPWGCVSENQRLIRISD